MNQLVQLIKNGFYILVFFVFSNSLGQAGNLNNDIGVFASANLEYKCIGNGIYEIELEVYAECGYFDGTLNNKDNYPITIESKSLGIKFEPKVLKSNSSPAREGEEINIYCPDQPSQCDTRDQNSFRGLKKYIFTTTVNLNQLGKASDWKVYWSRNNRSAEISTIGTNQPYHTEANINNITVCNSSPEINVKTVFGIKKGEAETIQLAPVDADGNQLRYSIVSPLKGLNTPINYSGGFSSSQPFGEGKSISVTNNGDILIPAIDKADVNANFDVLIEEFNGSTKVGESRKGFQITTLETENTAPVISGINDTEDTEITICAGQTLNFQIKGTDADGDKMKFIFRPTIIPNKNINFSGSFSYSTSPFLNFNWVTTSIDTGTFVVTVKLEDNACPVNLTTTKEFTIKVNPIPTFDLGAPEPFNCGNPQVLNPVISNAAGNLSYDWASWFIHPLTGDTVIRSTESTNTILAIDEPRTVTLLVSDDAGCARRDYTSFWESLGGSMSFTRRCIGQTTSFTDASTFNGSTFKSRKWTIETKTAVTTAATFDHTFPGLGGYAAELIVEDNLGCIDTVAETVYIVDQPTHGLALEDSCSIFLELDPTVEENRSGVDLIDETIYYAPGDGRGVITWTINTLSGDFIGQVDIPSSEPEQRFPDRYLDFAFPDSGVYVIKTETNTSATCVATNFDTVHIVQRPKLDLISDDIYSINCANPDTVFQAKLDSHFVGTSPYKFWYIDNEDEKSPEFSFTSATEVFEIPIDTVGEYTFWVQDSKGCYHYQKVEVVFSTDAALGYELQCEEGAIQFRDISSIDTSDRTISKWDWNFGDGNVSTLANPTHLYDTQGDYRVALEITDSKGCKNSDTLDVYYTFPASDLKIEPNIEVVKICVSDELTASNLILTNGKPYHIDELIWRFEKANGSLDTFYYDNFPTDPLMITEGLVQTYLLKDTTTQLKIENEINYNRNDNNLIAGGASCNQVYKVLKEFTVYPEFNGNIFDNRVCLGDSAIFKFTRTVNEEILIDSVLWTFRSAKTGAIVAQTTDLDPQVFIDQNNFTRGPSQIGVQARFVDINGCILNKAASFEVDEVTSKPSWDFTDACRDANVLFTLMAEQGDVDYWQINKMYVDSVTSGNFIAPKFDGDVIGSTVIKFSEAGDIPVSMFLIKNVSIQSGKICRARLDDTIHVYDVPHYDVKWDSVCSAVSPTTFINNSTIDGNFGTVVNYTWDFGDGSTLDTPPTQKIVEHRYADGGKYNVKLTATTTEGCNRSDTIFEVYVRPTPLVQYETDKEFLEAHEIITFTNTSELYGATLDSIFWDFGSLGKFYNEEEVMVEWDTIGVYYIKLAVVTTEGCIGYDDSLRIDLNTYLDLPNAFSPNGDGVNDELFLIYKSIYTLFDYKIFNRWGQVVFDSEGDLNKSWDGKFNGADQEVGVYVAHVKAEGAYNTQFNFKVNVRLIR